MAETPDISLRDRLAGLAAFLPVFDADGFTFGYWTDDPGTFPMHCLSADASRFVRAAYDLGWIVDFNWIEWADGPEGQRFLKDPAAIAEGDAETLARLLTAYMRKDRFCEGALASAFHDGYLTAIVRRALELLAEMGPPGEGQGEVGRSG